VEYKFIRDSVKFDFWIAPLDGNAECAGDAILSTEVDKWLLLEFKRDQQCIAAEKMKYQDYNKIMLELMNYDMHHFIIYGVLNDKKGLALVYRTYFSGRDCKGMEALMKCGKSLPRFKWYLEKLISKRLTNKSGGSFTSLYSAVLGVNADGQVVKCMSLIEFGDEYDMKLLVRRRELGYEISMGY